MHSGRLAAGAAALDSGAARIAERLADESPDSRRNRIAVRDRGFLGHSAACRKRNSRAEKGYRAHLKFSLSDGEPTRAIGSSSDVFYCPVIIFFCSIATAL